MKHSFIYLVALIYFAGLILFEAAQQYYYVTSFDLAGKGEISISGLLRLHSMRWVIWSLLALPYAWFIFRNPARTLRPGILLRYGIGLSITLLVTLLTISLVELWMNARSVTYFFEFFAFFTYQKSALFVNAYLGLIILIHLYQNLKVLDAKILELSDLKSEYTVVYNELKNRIQDDTPLIQIKIGNKVKNILLTDIIWVQSDDYCVKIHTEEGAYTLRKSMKRMEQELSSRGFVRVHRNAIVNKDEVDTLVYSPEPYVILKNGHSLPIASGRISNVKAFFKGILDFPA